LKAEGQAFAGNPRRVVLISVAVAAAGAALGSLVWYPEGMGRVYGFLLGMGVGVGKLVWSWGRTVRMFARDDLTEKGAALSARLTYLMNYVVMGAALAAAALIPQVDFWATAAGLFAANMVLIVTQARGPQAARTRPQE